VVSEDLGSPRSEGLAERADLCEGPATDLPARCHRQDRWEDRVYRSAGFVAWRTSVHTSAARKYAREASWLFGEVEALYGEARELALPLNERLREQVGQAEDVASEARALATTAWHRAYLLAEPDQRSEEIGREVGRHHAVAYQAAERACIALGVATRAADDVAQAVLTLLDGQSSPRAHQALRRRASRLVDSRPPTDLQTSL